MMCARNETGLLLARRPMRCQAGRLRGQIRRSEGAVEESKLGCWAERHW